MIRVLGEHGLLTLLLGGAAEFGRLARVEAFEREVGESPDPVRRLAALAVMTGADAERLREGFRLSNDEHKRLERYAALLEILKTWPLPIDETAMRRLAAEHGADALTDAMAAVGGEPRPILRDEAHAALRRYRTGEAPVPVFPLRGADLVAGGVAKGPRIGELLAQARQAWLAEGCPTDEAAAKALLQRVLAQAAG
jgi:poly(A) polymerase